MKRNSLIVLIAYILTILNYQINGNRSNTTASSIEENATKIATEQLIIVKPTNVIIEVDIYNSTKNNLQIASNSNDTKVNHTSVLNTTEAIVTPIDNSTDTEGSGEVTDVLNTTEDSPIHFLTSIETTQTTIRIIKDTNANVNLPKRNTPSYYRNDGMDIFRGPPRPTDPDASTTAEPILTERQLQINKLFNIFDKSYDGSKYGWGHGRKKDRGYRSYEDLFCECNIPGCDDETMEFHGYTYMNKCASKGDKCYILEYSFFNELIQKYDFFYMTGCSMDADVPIKNYCANLIPDFEEELRKEVIGRGNTDVVCCQNEAECRDNSVVS
uniref:Plasmodium vivax Vir protein n=1 Tax=Rhabditophanes sp. KR3021 TaxID=114890 RepID=A0AC35U8B6_9BILA